MYTLELLLPLKKKKNFTKLLGCVTAWLKLTKNYLS